MRYCCEFSSSVSAAVSAADDLTSAVSTLFGDSSCLPRVDECDTVRSLYASYCGARDAAWRFVGDMVAAVLSQDCGLCLARPCGSCYEDDRPLERLLSADRDVERVLGEVACFL